MKQQFFFFFFFLIIFFSCKKTTNKRENVFRYNESQGITSLDPAQAKSQSLIWAVNQIFNGLVQLDEKLKVKACIAKRWQVSEDGKVYSFVLRDDVYFHDHKIFPQSKGRKVVAADFVYSFNRLLSPKVASPGRWTMAYVNKVITVNDTSLKIILKKPFPAFLSILSMQYFSVVPKEITEHYGNDFGFNPIGTGAFYMKIWKQDEKLILRRNQNYFEKNAEGEQLPHLEAVAISFIKDKQSEFLEFLKGNLDFISGINHYFKDEVLDNQGNLNKKYEDKISLYKSPYLNTEYLGFLVDSNIEANKNNPVNNIWVRKAINLGFDRKKMMKVLRNNIGIPATNGFLPPSLLDNKTNGYYYNKEKAKYYLQKAGYNERNKLPIISLTTTAEYMDIAEYLQYELSQIGIRLTIEVSTGGTFRSNVANSKLSFFRASWIADYPDAENYLSLFYSKNFSPDGPNYTHFKSELYDSLYLKSLKIRSIKERQELYKQLDSLIIDNACVVPLYYDEVVRFVQKSVNGLEANPINLLILKNVKKK